ncbi:MAG: metal-dependent hydrolase [Methylococcales bacterium]|nr:metal-dependent hydrolase [Methylococcales bacterium]
MDTLTHALIGAVTARACTKVKKEKSRDHSLMFVAALAAAFPDIDYLLFWVNPYRFITEWHRGLSHSLVMLPVWSALLSTAAFLVIKRQIPYRVIFGYCSLGLLTHIIVDLITLYGLKVFTPLSDQRFALSLAFDLDPWVGLITLLGLVFGLNNRSNAIFALIAIGIYLSLLFYFQQNALAVIDNRTRISQRPIDNIYALPQPFMPFHWKLVIDYQTYYETAHLSLLGKGTSLMDNFLTNTSCRIPVFSSYIQCKNDHKHFKKTRNQYFDIHIIDFHTVNQLEWQIISKHGDTQQKTKLALEVWQHDSFSKFRKFSSIPILYRIDTDISLTCIWYTDMRYIFPLIKPPFRYGMCHQHSNNDWQLFRLLRNTEKVRQLIE